MAKRKEIVEAGSNLPAEIKDAVFGALDKYQEDHHVFEPGFMIVKPNKGTTTYQCGSLGAVDSPLVGIILSVDIRRVLWPFGTEKEIKEMKAWTGKRPFCVSKRNGGNVGEPPKLVDPDCPEIAKQVITAIMDASCRCKKPCAWNDWNPEGGGKRCKETRALLLWLIDIDMPALISITPSSLKAWRGYVTSLPGQRFDRVVTELHTTSATNDFGTYNLIDFKPAKAKGAIIPIPDGTLEALGKQVSYGVGTCMVLQALLAEFAEIEIDEEFDYPNGDAVTVEGTVVDDDVPFSDKGTEF